MGNNMKFSDLAKMTDREIQVLLRQVDQKDLVVSLKETTKAVRDKVLGNMSQRVRGFISEEVEFLGPMPSAEIKEVQGRIVKLVESLGEQGLVALPGSGTPSKKAPKKRPSKALREKEKRQAQLAGKSLDQCSLEEINELFTRLAEKARRQGILALEENCGDMDAFAKSALLLAVDGTEPALICDLLQTWMRSLLHEHEVKYRKVIEGMMAIQAGDNPRIVEHKLSVIY